MTAVVSPATAWRVGQRLAEKLGVEASRDAITAVPVDRLVHAQAELRADLVSHPDPDRWGGEAVTTLLPWQPVVDGDVIPALPSGKNGSRAATESCRRPAVTVMPHPSRSPCFHLVILRKVMEGNATLVRPRTVVIGAGFGGLWAARALAGAPVDVLLLDRNNFHVFLPLLYQVAAAELEPEDIVYPVRGILRGIPNVSFGMADVIRVDLASRTVVAADRVYPYDFLILAAGSTSTFFGVPGAETYALPLKTLAQAIALRNRILGCFERAAQEEDSQVRRRLLSFVIVGGGATGVEFAGALAELIRGPLTKDFPALDCSEVRVELLEAQGSLLPGLPERLRAYALSRLRRIGVFVRLNATVSEVTSREVRLKEGLTIPTETTIWTTGVRGESIVRSAGLPIVRGERLAVLPTLQVVGHPEVYAVGDIAYMEEIGRPLPMMAPVAIQQGTAAAGNILRCIGGGEPLPFRYRDPGVMVILGRNAAVAHVGGRSFTGFPAWALWLIVHIYKLIGARNRLVVLINWAWDYLFFERAQRLILP